jgi:hypothetical protein
MKLAFLIQLIFLLVLIVGVYLVFTNSVEGKTKLILIVLCLVIGIYLFLKLPLFKNYNELVSSPVSARIPHTIDGEDLKKSEGHFAISSWIFIDDWNYKYGEKKIILVKEILESSGSTSIPKIYLDEYKNDLYVDLNVISYNDTDYKTALKNKLENDSNYNNTIPVGTTIDENVLECSGNTIFNNGQDTSVTCTMISNTETVKIENINMQKWVNILVTVNNRTMDVYINGKLVQTKSFNNIIDTNAFNHGGINVTPNGGFGGFISKVQYYPYYVTPQKAWSIYRQGFGDVFESALNKYNLSVSFYEDSIEKGKYYVF